MSGPVPIALFTDSLQPSGVGQVMLTLARRLSRQRYTLFLICCCSPRVDDFVERMRPHVTDVARLAVREDEEHPRGLEQLVQQLRAWKIEIFHNHIGATWEGGFGTLAARCAGIPAVVATEHLPNVLRTRHELEHRRAMNRLLDRIFTVSESVRHSLLACDLAPAEKVVVVENGVEVCPVRQARHHARRELGIPEDRPVILFLGRLVEQKDPATLLRAVRLLRDAGRPATTLFAGDGWLREELEALSAQLQLGELVRFLGNRGDVDRLFAAAEVLALPSRFEGLPLAALEAMSTGLPVVGCDAPGVRDAVAHGVSGWLAPIGDGEGLARGLRLSLADEPGRQWASAARQRYARQFSAQRMAERYCQAYEETLTAGRRCRLSDTRRTVFPQTRVMGEHPELSEQRAAGRVTGWTAVEEV